MLALTDLVFPGFFRPRTLEMGSYLGIYDGPRLAAMAGERMRLDGYQELSRGLHASGLHRPRLCPAPARDPLQFRIRPGLHAVPSRVCGQCARDRCLPQDSTSSTAACCRSGRCTNDPDRDRTPELREFDGRRRRVHPPARQRTLLPALHRRPGRALDRRRAPVHRGRPGGRLRRVTGTGCFASSASPTASRSACAAC